MYLNLMINFFALFLMLLFEMLVDQHVPELAVVVPRADPGNHGDLSKARVRRDALRVIHQTFSKTRVLLRRGAPKALPLERRPQLAVDVELTN